jgi:hypothetical protein
MNKDEELDKRMKDAGMMSLTEMLEKHPSNPFMVHAGMTDLKSFGEWLDMRHKEMSKMQANMILDKKEDSEMFEWVLSHAAVLGEVVANFKAIKN